MSTEELATVQGRRETLYRVLSQSIESKSLVDIFGEVKAHLLSQNKRAIEGEGKDRVCKYRTESGLKCAVGCLVPDSLYTPDMELASVAAAVKYRPVDSKFELMAQLQDIHDENSPPYWKDLLDVLVFKWKSSYAIDLEPSAPKLTVAVKV